MDELLKKAKAAWQDEMNGEEKYKELAEMAEKARAMKEAAILRDMAREEGIHAHHLRNIMHEHAKPEDYSALEEMWKKTHEPKDK